MHFTYRIPVDAERLEKQSFRASVIAFHHHVEGEIGMRYATFRAWLARQAAEFFDSFFLISYRTIQITLAPPRQGEVGIHIGDARTIRPREVSTNFQGFT